MANKKSVCDGDAEGIVEFIAAKLEEGGREGLLKTSSATKIHLQTLYGYANKRVRPGLDNACVLMRHFGASMTAPQE